MRLDSLIKFHECGRGLTTKQIDCLRVFSEDEEGYARIMYATRQSPEDHFLPFQRANNMKVIWRIFDSVPPLRLKYTTDEGVVTTFDAFQATILSLKCFTRRYNKFTLEGTDGQPLLILRNVTCPPIGKLVFTWFDASWIFRLLMKRRSALTRLQSSQDYCGMLNG